MNKLKAVRLSDLKTQARLLFKDFNSPVLSVASAAAKRFEAVPELRHLPGKEKTSGPGSIKLKHAYRVLASELGFKSWDKLKEAVVHNDCLYRQSGIAYVHKWFKPPDLLIAEQYLSHYGGYLLRFWDDIIICGKEYISCLHLEQYEKEWALIGYNWVRPLDSAAYSFLKKQAILNYHSIN